MNYEIWTLPNSGDFARKQDITKWVLPGTEWDIRLLDLPAGQLIVHRTCPFLDDILAVDRANHANDVGSTLMIFDEGTWVGAMVPTEREDDAGSEDAPVVFTLEGLEWFMDRARVEAYDHPADPIREGDWIYGHPTILTPAGGEVTDTQYQLTIVGASSGDFKITDGTDTTSALAYDIARGTLETRLETDITAIVDIEVSGQGTETFEFIMYIRDPAGTDITLTVTDDTTNGTVTLSKIQTGGNPSPRPWHGSIDGNTGTLIGNYEAFDMVEAGSGSNPSAPSGSASTYLLKIDGGTPASTADYAGGQVEAEVIWGHRYRAEIKVYSPTSQTVRFIARTITEVELGSDEQTLSAATWTTMSFDFTPPQGVDVVVYRVGIIDSSNPGPIFLDVNEAILAPGADEAPFGEICNDLLAPIQTRSVVDWWTETFSDTQDSTSENWDRDLAVRVRRGQSFFQWLEYGSRWGYERSLRWSGSVWNFGLYNPGNLGTDYTGQGGPTVSVFDGGVGSSPVIQRVPDFTTAIAEGDAGTWGEYTDATLATGWGRLEGYFANRQNMGSGGLDGLAQQMVTDTDAESDSVRVTVQNPSVRPGVDVLVGDTVPVLVRGADGSLTPKMLRCVQISVSETETAPLFTYHFGSPVFDAETATQEALRTLIRRYQALDSLGDGGGTVEPLAISSPVPSTALTGGQSTLTDIETYTAGSGSNPHPWKIPSAAASGDLVLAAISMQDAGGVVNSVPTGWTLEWSSGQVNSAAQYLYSRVLDGTETYSDTWTTIGSTKVCAAWWGVKANGGTLTTTIATSATLDPPTVSPPVNGDYWVFPLSFANKGEPDPDETGALSTGFDLLVYLASNATAPSSFVAQLFLQKDKRTLSGNVDPAAIGWADTSGGRTYNSVTVLVEAVSTDPTLAAFGHTHVEADVTDLAHTDADAIHDNVAGEIAAITAKATPTTSDILLIEDAAASNAKKKITIGDLPATSAALDDLTDVTITTPSTNEVLKYNGSAWVNDTDATGSGLPTGTTKGDLAVYNGTSWVRIGAGANDTVLTADSAQTEGIKWAAAGGGGGGTVPEWIEYLAARQSDETSHADDDFFGDGTKTGWTEATVAGTATWTESRGLMSVKASGGATNDGAVCVKSIGASGPPYTIETAVNLFDVNADFHGAGIVFCDGTSAGSNQVSARVQTRNNGVASLQVTSGTLTLLDATQHVAATRTGREDAARMYIRLVQTAANTWAANFSSDGVNWSDVGLAPFSFTMTPTHYGLIVGHFGGSTPLMASFDYFRVYESDLDV